jgi:mono/diheme cytochrome c family protein
MTRAVRRSVSILLVCGGSCVAVLLALAGYESSPAAAQRQAASPTMITVTAGKPTEFAFRLSKSSLLPWRAKTPSVVTFKVTNRGASPHNFKICTTPTKVANANSCAGKGTKVLRPGQSTTLAITFERRGSYEYLSSLPEQAAQGMKGLIGVGVKQATTSRVTPVTTETTTTTATGTTPPSSLVGDPSDGKVVFSSAGCGSCHSLASAGDSGTSGPNLALLRPSQAVVVGSVTNGGDTMPSYAETLTPTQINDVAAYVYLTTHTIN